MYAELIKDLRFVPSNVCNPRFWVPSTLIKGNVKGFRDPNPSVPTFKVERKTPSFIGSKVEGLRVQGVGFVGFWL